VRENFTSVTTFVRATVPKMPSDGRASIVNVTSIEAHRAGPGFAIYSAMKAALASLTKSLALELGDRRIRVNCVAPDVIPTPGVGEMPVKTPLPFAGHVDDVAGAVIYLASDMSRFVTGTTVHVDGGNLAAGGWGRTADGSWVTAGEESGA
jgi:NAD(P)-dependent dehydrogenase (short-subunit alcohol dehydrogenase family)